MFVCLLLQYESGKCLWGIDVTNLTSGFFTAKHHAPTVCILLPSGARRTLNLYPELSQPSIHRSTSA